MYPFIRPTMPPPQEWVPLLATSYEARRYSNFGPVVSSFECRLAERYGDDRRAVVAVASGTAGLAATLLALDVQGTVAIPSFTFAATACAIRLASCTPLFVDVSPDTWELDLGALERLLDRERVGAIVHVRSLGLCRELRELEELARAHEVPLVVDSAACLGGLEEGGAAVGGRGDAEVFSLHATKPFGVGEGGAVFIRDEFEERLRQTINFGLANGMAVVAGLNAKLSEAHAAIGLAVMRRIDAFLARRAEVARTYRTELASVPGIEHGRAPGAPTWPAYPVAVAGEAESVVSALVADGVEARRYYSPPLHRTPAFAQPAVLPTTDGLAARMLCLPVYSDMTDAELDVILAIADRALRSRSRRTVRAARQ